MRVSLLVIIRGKCRANASERHCLPWVLSARHATAESLRSPRTSGSGHHHLLDDTFQPPNTPLTFKEPLHTIRLRRKKDRENHL